MIRGIHHVGIHCQDIQRMIAFYSEALGFEMVGEFDWANEEKLDTIVDLERSVAKGAMMKSGTCYIELFQYAEPAPRNTRALTAADKGYTHICIDTDNIEEDFPRLIAAGLQTGGRQWVDMGHVRTLYCRDPEGNLIELQQCMPGNGMELRDAAKSTSG